MIELRHLSHLLAAAEGENLTRAAEDLEVAPSTLSASLKALETEVGIPLFKRFGAGLYPRSSALWLFRAGLPILLLERHIRRRVLAGPDAEPRVLNIYIDLKFTIGRVSKAVLRAIAATEIAEPLVLVHPVWIDDEPTPIDKGWSAEFGETGAGALTLQMIGPDVELTADEVPLMHDSWVLACRLASDPMTPPVDLAQRPVMAPAISQGLFDAVESHLLRTPFKRARLLQDHPGSLPRLMNDHPDACFLLPSSALAGRLGLMNVATTPLEPPLTTTLIARIDDHEAIAQRFLQRLRLALGEPEQTSAFTPELTSRRIRYFNLAHRLRSVSAAARTANVAQPALSEQLRKLELSLGMRLFDRRSNGVVPTRGSQWFAAAASALEKALRDIAVAALSSVSADERRLSLGVLPSVSQHGLLVNRIAEAVHTLRRDHPTTRVTVQEAPNGTLQDWVLRGRVGLAIVETGPPQLPRLPLGASEDLAVICDPQHALLPPGRVAFADLVKTPLALPTSQFGLRQLLDDAARSQRINLKPVMEIDALAMLIALMRHEPIATVLPTSAVRRELDAGELCAHPIVSPSVARRLFVIYSGDRALTEPEREFVGLLRGRLAGGEFNPLDRVSQTLLAPLGVAVH